MLQEFLRCGKKRADKPDSNFREVSSAELGVCSWSVWVSAYGNLPKGRHGSGGFIGGFLQWILVTKCKKKIPPRKSTGKSASRKQKIRRRTTPPRNPPARPKNPLRNLPTNPPVKPPNTRPVFFSISHFRLREFGAGNSGPASVPLLVGAPGKPLLGVFGVLGMCLRPWRHVFAIL